MSFDNHMEHVLYCGMANGEMATDVATTDKQRVHYVYGLLASDRMHHADGSPAIRYVGKTAQTITKRHQDHLSAARRGDKKFIYNWIRSVLRRGSEIVSIEIDRACSDSEVKVLERNHIAIQRPICAVNGTALTNQTNGGDGTVGYHFGEESKSKMRAAKLGKKASPEAVAKMVAYRTGRKMSESACATMRAVRLKLLSDPECKIGENISKGLMGHECSTETRQKIGMAHKGRKLSPETCAKMSKSKMGHAVTEETKLKMSLAGKGKKRSDEARARMSLAARNRPPVSDETRIKVGNAARDMWRIRREAKELQQKEMVA